MKIRSIYLWGAFLLLLLALAGLAYLGTFTRFHADDFCMAADANQLGLLGMLPKWYATWAGRFSFFLVSGLFGMAGPGFAGWLPVLAEAVWLAGLSWAVLPLIRRAGWPHPKLLALIAGALGLLVLLSSTPNLFQSFYWQDGLVNYSLGLIGLTFNCGLILRVWLAQPKTWGSAGGVFLLAFICGGFHEAFVAMQVALFALVFCIALVLGDRDRRRTLLPVLGAGLLGGLLALLIVVLAPGNQVRQGAVGDPPGLARIITFSLRNAVYIFGKYFINTPGWAFLSISLPFFAGWLLPSGGNAASHHPNSGPWWRQSWLRGMALVVLVAFMLVLTVCAAVVFALNAYPDDRTIIIPQMVIVAAAISASAWLGMVLRRSKILPNLEEKPAIGRALQFGILAILILSTGYSTMQTIAKVPDFQAYARAWDQRASVIQQAVESGATDVTVVGLNARFGIADLNESPDNWVNRCMAHYYHITNLSGQ